MTSSFPSLSLRCGRCGKTENLMRCTRCKVMLYCSREHQQSNYSDHKPACSAVVRKQRVLDYEEEKLRLEPGDDFQMPPRPFETSVGHFWGILGTRDYMRARFAVKQLEHARDMLRLCRSDNMLIRDMVPSLLLRLNLDQECYDFIKWWCTTGQDSHYDWGNTDLGYLDIQNADAFEPVSGLVNRFSDLGMVNTLALLKIRLLLDLVALTNSTDIPALQVIPPEIFNAIRSHVPRSPIVSQNRALLQRYDHTADIRELEAQVSQLYAHIHKTNPHCWGMLLYPGFLLEKEERPGAYSPGSFEEAQLMLGHSYDAWFETPGALAIIKAKYDASG